MTLDFMSVKTVSSSSLRAERESLRRAEQEKAQALEQVRQYLKCFNFAISHEPYTVNNIFINVILLIKYIYILVFNKVCRNDYEI